MHNLIKQWIFTVFLISIGNLAYAERGLLWKIEGGQAKPSYLLGTMHSDDRRITQLPKQVEQKLAQSSSFSSEIKMDLNNMMQASMMMFEMNNYSLKNEIPSKLYKPAVTLLAEYGFPEMIVDKMKPWAVAATLSIPKPKSGEFLDMKLYQLAETQGKKLYGLESVSEQIGAMEALPRDVQLTMLEQAIKQYPTLPQLIENLIQAYLSRDLGRLEQLSEESMSSSGKRATTAFNNELLVKRNKLMMSRMLPRLEEGNAFVAVGALHLPGETGLLTLLRKQGYRLTAVY